ncbi:MAG: hypothetical protein NT020_05270 [Chloroflexales bacterium]|nr:hypothetical protein [Chloroflexales bacterium]
MQRRWWSWIGAVMTMVLSLRFVLTRLRPVVLRPTADATGELLGDDTAFGVRRLIVSDLHLGGGDRLDDFNADSQFVDFVQLYAMTEPTELILAGDTFEFLQVTLNDVPDFEWTGRSAQRRLAAIIAAHPLVIQVLATFVRKRGNYLTFVIGNHDFELHYQTAKNLLRQKLGLAPEDERLRFCTRYFGDGMFIEHGNQFEPWNSFVRFEGISQPFELVRGTFAVKSVINPLERSPLPVAPYIDNVKPSSAFLWYLLSLAQLRDLQVVRFVAHGVILTVRSMLVPLAYRRSETLNESATTVRHLENQRRLRRALDTVRRVIERRTARQRETVPPYLMAHIERESRRQLIREVREFNVTVLHEMVKIAHDKTYQDTVLFICGHTHVAQQVIMNERQTYVNLGTWTDVITDLNTGRRQNQRCPFLSVRYDQEGNVIHEFLVWRSPNIPPTLWSPESIGRPRLVRRSQNPARFATDGVTITSWKNEGETE